MISGDCRRSGPNSKIVYMTAGFYLEAFRSFDGKDYILIIDECHEMSDEYQLVFFLVKFVLKNTRVLFMSATVSIGRIVQYFGDMPSISIDCQPPFEVTVGFRPRPVTEDLPNWIGSIIVGTLQLGAVALVFLPGLSEITLVHEYLTTESTDIDIHVLSCRTSIEDWDRLNWLTVEPDTRYVFLTRIWYTEHRKLWYTRYKDMQWVLFVDEVAKETNGISY
jgi:HrpA-like RNA helicase